MRAISIAWALCAAAGSLAVASAPSAAGYATRRSDLRKALPDAVTVVFGRAVSDSDDLRSGFYQEPNFYYLTGWTEPGAILMLSPSGETLFLPPKNAEAEKWTGVKSSPDDANRARDDRIQACPACPQAFEAELLKLLQQNPRLYALASTPAAARLKKLAPLREIQDARPALGKLRMKKSPEKRFRSSSASTNISIEAHRAAWKKAAPGLFEYQVATAMIAVFGENGCERPAYAPIVGSGPNSVFLHYSAKQAPHGQWRSAPNGCRG